MKVIRTSVLMLAVFLVILAACSLKPAPLMLDSFEGKIDKSTVDFGAAEKSSVEVFADKDKKVCGEQSLKIVYTLRPSGYMWVARGYNLDVKGAACWEVRPEEINWSKYNAISVYMYGRNSGGVVAFDIKDAGGEMWRFLLDDDFTGWKEIICPFEQFFVRKDWQPQSAEKNEKLDFPIMSFQFEPRLPGSGVYWFDCVKLVKVSLKKK